MEASKCPRCGEEPFFIEHVEKWYCYGCNSYIDEEEGAHVCPAEAEHEHAPQAPADAPHPASPKPAEPAPVAAVAPIPVPAPIPATVPQPAEAVQRSTMMAEELKAFESEPAPNEAQSLLESAPAQTGEMPAPVLDATHEELELPVVEERDEQPHAAEPGPEVVEIKVKVCPSCEQPLKYIEKYQRYYCYGCRKYAPKQGILKERPSPATKSCPECGAHLKFIDKYGEWYCFDCKSYPLRAKKAEAERPKVQTCTKCGEPLKLIEKYQRHYCYKCKEYAPKPGTVPASEVPKAQEGKACPACKGEMKFIKEYNEWYCFKCKKYSLRPSKPVLLL